MGRENRAEKRVLRVEARGCKADGERNLVGWDDVGIQSGGDGTTDEAFADTIEGHAHLVSGNFKGLKHDIEQVDEPYRKTPDTPNDCSSEAGVLVNDNSKDGAGSKSGIRNDYTPTQQSPRTRRVMDYFSIDPLQTPRTQMQDGATKYPNPRLMFMDGV